MVPDTLETSIQAVKRWALEEIERLVYEGTRPISTCATVESATREAAIARGNVIAHSGEIAEIETLVTLCERALERVATPAASTTSL